MATEEITISELELADEVLADMTLPVDTATETRAVTLKQLRAWLGSSLPTGFIIPAVGKISDERFTLLDGKTLSRAGTYEAFCNKVVSEVQAGNWFACSEDEYNSDISTYGQCGKFVVSNDYVRIPTITRFIGATITLSEIGKTYKESLPQHTHTVSIPYGYHGSSSTVAVKGDQDNDTILGNKSFVSGGANNSSLFQNGAKVQPDHTKYPYYMVISTEGQTAEVEIDINKVYEDLNLKANGDLSNVASVASSFKEASVGWGIPDYSAGVSKTNNTQYTAETDGLLWIRLDDYNNGSSLVLDGKTFTINLSGSNQVQISNLTLFISKGTKYKVVFGRTSSNTSITFFPCKGVK